MTHDHPEPWEFSAVAVGPSGRPGLFRPVAANGWELPSRIWIDAGQLVYTYARRPSRLDVKKCGPDMLERFVRLHGQADSDILAFARAWGPLQFCSHGLPAAHNGGWLMPPPYYIPGKCGPEWRNEEGQVVYFEPLAAWRTYSREALAMLNLAASFRDGQAKASEPDLEFLGSWLDVTSAERGHTHEVGAKGIFDGVSRVPGRRRLADEGLNRWIYLGGVRPSVEWTKKGPPIVQFSSPGLFGALALQLMLAVSGSDGWAVCSGCGLPYAPPHVPAANRRRYCQACRTAGVDRRHASRDSRARKRSLEKRNNSAVAE